MGAPFVNLADDQGELRRMLQELQLMQANEIPKVTSLTGGVSSSIFRVDLTSGPLVVKQALPKLKVAKDWYAPTSRVQAEIDWLITAQAIVPGRVPLIMGVDQQRGAFAMEYLEHARPWKSDLLAGQVDLALGEIVAADLARIHQATANDPDTRRRFSHDATFFALRLEPYFIEAARMNPDLASQLIELVHNTQNTSLALVHGDVSPKNIVISARGPVLLDAETACYGDPAFDLAFLLNHILLKAIRLPAHRDLFLALYDRVATIYIAKVNWEPRREFVSRCAALLPGFLLARVDGKSPVEYLDRSARDIARSAARDMIARPVSELDHVRRNISASLEKG